MTSLKLADLFTYTLFYLKSAIMLFIYTFLILVYYFPIILTKDETQKNIILHGFSLTKRINEFFGIKFQIEGLEHFCSDQNRLILLPHQSAIDMMVIAAYADIIWGTYVVSKTETLNIPFLGQLFSLSKYIVFINRKDREGTIKKYRDLFKNNSGIQLAVFIEGTRNSSRTLLPFKKGPFEIALEYKLPIQMLAVSQYEPFRSNKPKASINAIGRLLPPISVDNYTKDNITDLIRHCQYVLQLECNKLNKEVDERDKLE